MPSTQTLDAETQWEIAALADGQIATARLADNGHWYATVRLDRRWVSDADFSTCAGSESEAVRRCAASVRADLRGNGNFAPHWDRYDVLYRLLPTWRAAKAP